MLITAVIAVCIFAMVPSLVFIAIFIGLFLALLVACPMLGVVLLLMIAYSNLTSAIKPVYSFLKDKKRQRANLKTLLQGELYVFQVDEFMTELVNALEDISKESGYKTKHDEFAKHIGKLIIIEEES
jgi:hypothetical protein